MALIYEAICEAIYEAFVVVRGTWGMVDRLGAAWRIFVVSLTHR